MLFGPTTSDIPPFGPPFRDARRIVFVHAHPDDETISTGALIAALAASGRHCFVLTATRGEQGEVRPGVLAHGGDLTALRLAEWERACHTLGAAGSALLGTPPARGAGEPTRVYADSGMVWLDASETLAGPDPDAPADALTSADPEEVAADIAAYATAVGADLLVGYDAYGGYGHPDHTFLHAPVRAAASALGLPLVEIVSQPRPGASEWPESPDADARPAVTLDLRAHRDAMVAALKRYASQVRVDGDEIVHVGGQREPIQVRVGVRPVLARRI